MTTDQHQPSGLSSSGLQNWLFSYTRLPRALPGQCGRGDEQAGAALQQVRQEDLADGVCCLLHKRWECCHWVCQGKLGKEGAFYYFGFFQSIQFLKSQYFCRRSYLDWRQPTLCTNTPGSSLDLKRIIILRMTLTGILTLSIVFFWGKVRNCQEWENFITICNKHIYIFSTYRHCIVHIWDMRYESCHDITCDLRDLGIHHCFFGEKDENKINKILGLLSYLIDTETLDCSNPLVLSTITQQLL